MTKVTTMTAAALLAVLVAPASARDLGQWYGVDMDAVPWPEFCVNVAAVPVERGGGRCEVSHPASQTHGRMRDYSGQGANTPPHCGMRADEYKRLTAPVEGSSDPWHHCVWQWGVALKERATEPARFREPFTAWRSQYFGPWLKVGGEQ